MVQQIKQEQYLISRRLQKNIAKAIRVQVGMKLCIFYSEKRHWEQLRKSSVESAQIFRDCWTLKLLNGIESSVFLVPEGKMFKNSIFFW
jgi:hypothetical protein